MLTILRWENLWNPINHAPASIKVTWYDTENTEIRSTLSTAACYRLLVLNLVERSEQPPDFHSNNFVFIYLVVFDSYRPLILDLIQ